MFWSCWMLLITTLAASSQIWQLAGAESIVVRGTAYEFEQKHHALLDPLIRAGRLDDVTSFLARFGRVVESAPIEEEELYDEDDAFSNEVEMGWSASTRLPQPWPKGVIPYTFLNVNNRTIDVVEYAMRDITMKTCVVFKPRTNEKKYVAIKDTSKGCWTSHLGYPSRKKVMINLGKNCRYHGIATHEVGHALGFIHEHTRPNRDEFVNIMWNNLAKKGPFKKKKEYITPELPYDYKSVMHYSRGAFSVGKTDSIVPKVNVVGRLGNKKLSRLDILRINTFYKCPV